MKKSELKQLIVESIQEYMRNIDEAGNIAALEAKMNRIDEEIRLREEKIGRVNELAELQEFVDPAKINEIKKEVNVLKKGKEKYKNQLEKMKNKGKKSSEKEEKKPIEDGKKAEKELDEAKKMTSAQKAKKEDIAKGMKKSGSFGKSKEEKGKMYATATKLATK